MVITYTTVDPLTHDCADWARHKQRELRGKSALSVRILYVSPKPPYQRLGAYKLPGGLWFSPPFENVWTHHYAVIAGQEVFDECYGNGLSLPAYKLLFREHDLLQFTVLNSVKREHYG